jgi:long-chain acyl-CoA synthetase
MGAQSVWHLFAANAQAAPDATAALVKHNGVYHDVSWNTLHARALEVAAGLCAMGVLPGDRVALLATTSLDWVVADMGILAAGAVTVPIYPSSTAEEVAYVLCDAGARVALVEDAAQADKVVAPAETSGGQANMGAAQVVRLDAMQAFLAGGATCQAEVPARIAGLSPESILSIIYTSGTTGRPKGVVTTHAAMLYEAEVIAEVDFVRPDDVQFLFLPLAHSFARLLVIAWIATRHQLAFAESIDTIRANLREVRPTLMCAVPRVFEKFLAAVAQAAAAGGPVSRHLFARTCTLGQQRRRGSLSRREAFEWRLLRRWVLAKIGARVGELLGGRMRVMGSGGAPVAPELLWFFDDIGFPILEGYGLTETTAGTVLNVPGAHKFGTVGRPVRGTELRIAEDGEIWVRGPGLMREYWQNPEATAAVMQGGWFATGDVGALDSDGYLAITDRKKDIIITAGGKNIAPQPLENQLRSEPLISQALVHGDRRPYLVALLTLDAAALDQRLGPNGTSYAHKTQDPRVQAEVASIVAHVNARQPPYQTIKAFRVLECDFSAERGELTPTLKLRRRALEQRYADLLAQLYENNL